MWKAIIIWSLAVILGARNGMPSQHQHDELESGQLALGFACLFRMYAQWMNLYKLYTTWEHNNNSSSSFLRKG